MIRAPHLLFRLAAVGAAVALLIHAAALAVPEINQSLYSATYPWWRHVIFIAINGTLAWLLPRPPVWLVWSYGLLTIQVLNSHGLGGFHEWQRTGRVNWMDVAAVVGVPLLLILLVVDRRQRPVTDAVP